MRLRAFRLGACNTASTPLFISCTCTEDFVDKKKQKTSGKGGKEEFILQVQ